MAKTQNIKRIFMLVGVKPKGGSVPKHLWKLIVI